MRKSYEEIEALKKQYSTDILWSWSRVNAFLTDKYEYYLRYVNKATPDRDDGIYGYAGGAAHNILEDFYSKKITYDDMIEKFDEQLLLMEIRELKYNRSDEEKNQKIADKYEACLKHFFKNHIPIPHTNLIEYFTTIDVNGETFQGYIDFMHIEKCDEDISKVYVTDWKTSTIYSSQKISELGKQLILYSEGIRQKLNIPLEKITARWCFMKYVTATYEQANGALKSRNIERHAICSSLAAPIRMWLKKLGYEEQMEDLLQRAILENSLECLPDEVKAKFEIADCYVEVPLSEEIITDLKDHLHNAIKDIRKRTEEYTITKDENLFWQDVTDKDEFRLATLSNFSRKLHKPYDVYLTKKEEHEKMYSTEDAGEEDADLMDFLSQL